ncbi:4'-phosphopantetheinyl transferase family protein [Holdemania massiliensis]|nr:4'-phosphopantetheinyl transferase superfamily protein [Holdemania massiliensis]
MIEAGPRLFSGSLDSQSSAGLLQKALKRQADMGILPFIPTERTLTPQGKPYFADLPALHFSISHCGQQWVCLFASQPVGIDIEQPRRCREEAIARRFFHPLEQAWLTKHPETFFQIWTAKESFVKWSGCGIDSQFSKFSVIDEHGALYRGEDFKFIPWITKKGTPGTMCLSASLSELYHAYELD